MLGSTKLNRLKEHVRGLEATLMREVAKLVHLREEHGADTENADIMITEMGVGHLDDLLSKLRMQVDEETRGMVRRPEVKVLVPAYVEE